MRLTYLAYTFSLAMMYYSIVFIMPILVAFIYNETNAVLPFLVAGASTFLIATTIRKLFPASTQIKSINDIKKGEGLCAVTLCWVMAGLLASVPYLFFGLNPINALFEATSGITATGATIFTHFDYTLTLNIMRG